MEKNIIKLPAQLTSLVNECLGLLGQAAQIEYGDKVFKEVEKIRQLYKAKRSSDLQRKLETHKAVSKILKPKSTNDKLAIAHCFAASLEIINACENAYRSHRLAQASTKDTGNNVNHKLPPIIFVLTAHPTEARSPAAVEIFEQLSVLLLSKLRNPQQNALDKKQLFHLMILLVKTPLSKSKAPTVQDEADYIYSIILKNQNIDKLCDYFDTLQPVFIRTWVGGDKDGHPGVNDKAMLNSLRSSRKKIIPYALVYAQRCLKQLGLIDVETKNTAQLRTKIMSVVSQLKSLHKLEDGDGVKLNRLYKTLAQVILNYTKVMGAESPELGRLWTLLNVFPGLVVPLELREDSALIKQSISKPDMEIVKMVKLLRRLCKSGQASWYVRGLVISMCESEQDVINAIKLLNKHLGGLQIPIVPLFETRSALEASSELTKKILAIPDFKNALEKKWDKKYEVMVGYSDSSKESGALFSRVIIQKSLSELEKLVVDEGYIPIFFHGSGGSVARGGGSLKEQMAWWPKSARQRFKATIQGEMIHRTFSTVEIFDRQVSKIRESCQQPKIDALNPKLRSCLDDFAENVRQCYYKKVTDSGFMDLVSRATPYPYLDQLKIGSRPSKRKSTFDLKSLRAIPWVLCWTQTRVLFPVWWGVGRSWNKASEVEKRSLRAVYKKSGLFSSYVSLLGYTIAKTDLSLWAFYLESSGIETAKKQKYLAEFTKELQDTLNFVHEVTGKKDILWFRPWLTESIKLRSTLIYPLNILEVEALQTKDVPLLRETVTGIASGMLTTG